MSTGRQFFLSHLSISPGTPQRILICGLRNHGTLRYRVLSQWSTKGQSGKTGGDSKLLTLCAVAKMCPFKHGFLPVQLLWHTPQHTLCSHYTWSHRVLSVPRGPGMVTPVLRCKLIKHVLFHTFKREGHWLHSGLSKIYKKNNSVLLQKHSKLPISLILRIKGG